MDSSNVPQLTILLKGYGWKARFHIHVMMTTCGIGCVRDFVKLYLLHMPFDDSNLEAVKQIVNWFPAALDVATNDWKQASREYVEGYRLTANRKQEAQNKKLLKAVEVAKKAMNRLENRKKVFIEECIARRIPID